MTDGLAPWRCSLYQCLISLSTCQPTTLPVRQILSTGIPSPGLKPSSPIPEGSSRELEPWASFDCRREVPALLPPLIPTPLASMALQASKMPLHPVFAGCRQVPWGEGAGGSECKQIAWWRSLWVGKISVWFETGRGRITRNSLTSNSHLYRHKYGPN